MINETAEFFENTAKQFNLSIKIPRPGRKAKDASALTNGLVGIGFVMSGLAFRKASLTAIGVLGLAGAAILALEE